MSNEVVFLNDLNRGCADGWALNDCESIGVVHAAVTFIIMFSAISSACNSEQVLQILPDSGALSIIILAGMRTIVVCLACRPHS